MPLGRVPGGCQVLQADMIGFAFVHTAVIEHGRLPRAHGAYGQSAAARSAGGHARDSQQERTHCQVLRPFQAGGHMALGHMGQLMGQHARQVRPHGPDS